MDEIDTTADVFADQLMAMLGKRLKLGMTLSCSSYVSGELHLHVMVMLSDTKQPEQLITMVSQNLTLPLPKLTY